MIIYKQVNDVDGNPAQMVMRVQDYAFIPFDSANTDYQTFCQQILADEAQLENADGVLMSPDEAKAFVATLP